MDSSEFRSKVVSIAPSLYTLAARLLKSDEEAEDAVQEVMIKLWQKRRMLKSHPNPSGYAYLATRNHCLDLVRKREKERWPGESAAISDTESDLAARMEGEEARSIIESILEGLPEKQREAVMMRDIDGLGFEEMAAVTGERKEILRVLLSRGRKRIRKKLEEIYSYEYGTSGKNARVV